MTSQYQYIHVYFLPQTCCKSLDHPLGTGTHKDLWTDPPQPHQRPAVVISTSIAATFVSKT